MELGRTLDALFVDDDALLLVVLARSALLLLWRLKFLGEATRRLRCRCTFSSPRSPARCHLGLFFGLSCGVIPLAHCLLFFLKLVVDIVFGGSGKGTTNKLILAQSCDAAVLLLVGTSFLKNHLVFIF